MENQNVKTGKEVLDEFFKEITSLENVDKNIAKAIADLYLSGSLTDKNLTNELLKIRKNNENEN